MSCARAPASDHETNVYVVGPSVGGDTASMLRTMPATPVNVVGAVWGWPSLRSWRPGGLVCSVTLAVRGLTSRKTACVSPPESWTVRWMRYQTFDEVSPSVGIVNE